jgi:DTW domain-containing protein YfiP
MHLVHCVCSEVRPFTLATKIVLVVHKREIVKTTTTGPIALLALPNHEQHVHGVQGSPLDLSHLQDPGRRLWILFPSDDARPIDQALLDEDARPVTLVVPEGNWGQASRMARRLPGLVNALRVVLPPGPRGTWSVRAEPRAGGMSTMEAIARAVGHIESTEAQAGLERLFRLVNTRTMMTRQVPSGTGQIMV